VKGNTDYQPSSFTDVIHLERAESWNKLSQLDHDELTEVSDHWFFKNQIIAGTSDTFKIDLPHPRGDSERQVKIRMKFQGMTYGAPQHQVTTLLNNRFISVDTWSGQKVKIISSEGQNFSHGHLNNGENLLTVVMSGDPTIDRQYDMVLLDWARIEYERYFRAYHDHLRFRTPTETGPGKYLYELNGFTSPDVMIIKNDRFWLRDYMVFYDSKYRAYSVLFQDESLNGAEKYVAVGPQGVVEPDTVIYRDPKTTEINRGQGDYIIISHPDFMEDLDDFVQLQQVRGFSPVVVDVTHLYDRYSHGNRSPYAIRDYLKEAWESWSLRPRYALLVGDAGSTGRSTYEQGMFIPTQFFQTYRYGACVTDTWYGDVDNDTYQEIIIGRLPVRDREQLEQVIAKLRAWHEKPVIDEWLNRIVMIAGYEDEFKMQTESVISQQMSPSVQVDRLYINPSAETGPFYGTTATLSDMINDGKSLINFRGHGGGAVWSDRSLFTMDDVEKLENENKPCVITSFTCFTAAFETERGLGEGLIRLPGGSVSFLGSSGLGWVVNDYLMLQAIYQYLFKDGVSFGKAIQLGKLQYVFATGWATHAKTGFHQYNILGDPSIIMPFDYQRNNLTVEPPDAGPGDDIAISFPGYQAGAAMLDLTFRGRTDKKQPILQNRLFKPSANSQINITLPDTISADHGDLTVFYWNENDKSFRAGHAPLSFGTSLIYEPFFPDKIPEIGESASFQVKVRDSQGVDSVWVVWSDNSRDLMTPVGQDICQSPVLAWNSAQGRQFSIRVRDGNGHVSRSPVFTLKPLPGADLRMYSVTCGAEGLSLSVGSSVNDEIYGHLTCILDDNTILTDTLMLVRGMRPVKPDIILPYGEQPLRVEIYPIGYQESDSSNNVWTGTVNNDRLYVTSEGISAYPEGMDLNHSHFKKLDMKSTSEGFFVGLNYVDTLFDLRSSGAVMDEAMSVPFLDFDSEHIAYRIIYNPGENDSSQIPAVYNPGMGYLLKLIETEEGYAGTIPGYLLRIKPTDTEPPNIEVTVNSRKILPGSYVSDGARFSVLITDNILVHTDARTRDVYLNGERMDHDQIKVIADPSGRRLGLNFSPAFSLGQKHTLSVKAEDGLGNIFETPEYELITTNSARIIDYGCFPNPFTANTRIIYELTSQFDEVFIDIFTVSGKRIFRIDRFNAETDLPMNDVGYHEIPWYGRDKDDEFVANGVYFYRIFGKISAEIFTARGKVVKLR
jgi:hypothetical protein